MALTQSDIILRHMMHPDVGEVELATSSAMSGTLDMRASTLGSERETMDATSLPLSVSSDTAFTSFYGSQANLKSSRSTARIPSNDACSTMRSSWSGGSAPAR